MPYLETRRLSIGFNNTPIISNLNISIDLGEFVCVMGANGIGKSTLLKTLAGLISPVSGEILVGDRKIETIARTELAKKIGIVLTDSFSSHGLSVAEVIALGRYPHTNYWGKLKSSDVEKIDEALKMIKFKYDKTRLFSNLSDGEKQKVIIAKAIAQETPLILLDEPTSFLDISSKMEILLLLKKLVKEKKISVLFSSHDWDLILKLVDKIIVIQPDGAIFKGTPEDLLLNDGLNSFNREKEFQLNYFTGNFEAKDSFYTAIRAKIELDKPESNKFECFWTKHALSKAGIKVIDDENSDIRVKVFNNRGKVSWMLGNRDFPLLEDLIKFIL